jgi:hypothetical protein
MSVRIDRFGQLALAAGANEDRNECFADHCLTRMRGVAHAASA